MTLRHTNKYMRCESSNEKKCDTGSNTDWNKISKISWHCSTIVTLWHSRNLFTNQPHFQGCVNQYLIYKYILYMYLISDISVYVLLKPYHGAIIIPDWIYTMYITTKIARTVYSYRVRVVILSGHWPSERVGYYIDL